MLPGVRTPGIGATPNPEPQRGGTSNASGTLPSTIEMPARPDFFRPSGAGSSLLPGPGARAQGYILPPSGACVKLLFPAAN